MDIRLTKTTVEAFYHGARVASHPRSDIALRNPITKPEHMPEEHRKYLTYSKEDFISWAEHNGGSTTKVVKYFLLADQEPEQGYKSCASLTKLSDKYGHERLENACQKVLEYTMQPSIRMISSILKNGQDRVQTSVKPVISETVGHGITRGAAYFQKGGERS